MRAVKIFIVILSIQCVYAVAGELKLPDCPNSPKLETEIYFYIDENVLDEYSKNLLTLKLILGWNIQILRWRIHVSQ